MKNFSAWTLARNALTGHDRWPRQWRSADPKRAYDVVIIGAGIAGLSAAVLVQSRADGSILAAAASGAS